MCPPRIRVYPGTATVYVDAANGVDTNDGTCAYSASNPPGVGPVKSLQLAVDMASANFDVGPPLQWGSPSATWVAYRPGVNVQMAPAPVASPYILNSPLILDGLSGSHPVYLLGDTSGVLANAANYNVYANTPNEQGISPQNGGVLICQGFSILAAPGCTIFNPLQEGKLALNNVRAGCSNIGLTAFGAAGGSHLDFIGVCSVYGIGWEYLVFANEGSQITMPFTLQFENRVAASGAFLACEDAGSLIDAGPGTMVFGETAAGYVAASTGIQAILGRYGIIMRNGGTIPGSGVTNDGTGLLV